MLYLVRASFATRPPAAAPRFGTGTYRLPVPVPVPVPAPAPVQQVSLGILLKPEPAAVKQAHIHHGVVRACVHTHQLRAAVRPPFASKRCAFAWERGDTREV